MSHTTFIPEQGGSPGNRSAYLDQRVGEIKVEYYFKGNSLWCLTIVQIRM